MNVRLTQWNNLNAKCLLFEPSTTIGPIEPFHFLFLFPRAMLLSKPVPFAAAARSSRYSS